MPVDFKYYQEDGLRFQRVLNTAGEWQMVLHDQNDNPFKTEARACLNRGDFEQALILYDLALRFNPFDPRNRGLLMEIEAVMGLVDSQKKAVQA